MWEMSKFSAGGWTPSPILPVGKTLESLFIPGLVYLENWGELENWVQIPQIMCINIQEVIQCVKLYISHQVKPYSNVKTIWGLIYICFIVFGALGQTGEIGPNYPIYGHVYTESHPKR